MDMPVTGRFTPEGTYQIAYRIYYEDTDSAGVVYYANYLKLAERARTDALRMLGIHQEQMRADGLGGFVVRRCQVEYHAPARLDDTLLVETTLLDASRVRMRMRQDIRRGEETCVALEVEIVMVDAAFRPTRIPSSLATRIMEQFGSRTLCPSIPSQNRTKTG